MGGRLVFYVCFLEMKIFWPLIFFSTKMATCPKYESRDTYVLYGSRHIMPRVRSCMMSMLGLQNQNKTYINGQRSCHYYQQSQKHYSSWMILLLTKALIISEFTISSRHCNHYLWLLTQSYLALPENITRQTEVNTIFVWYSLERADLKMIHDENNLPKHDDAFLNRQNTYYFHIK